MIDSLVLRKIPKHVWFQLISRPQDVEISCIVTHLNKSMANENFPQKPRFGVEKFVSYVENSRRHFFLVEWNDDEIFFVLAVGFFAASSRKIYSTKLAFGHRVAAVK